jgi:hypothetical protein
MIQGTSSFTLCSAAAQMRIDGADNPAFDNAVEVDLQDSSSAPNPPSDPDDAVSSDDDVASKVNPAAKPHHGGLIRESGRGFR